MTNFLEDEMRRLFENGNVMESPAFVGGVCLGKIDGDFRVKAELISVSSLSEEYDGLLINVINRNTGKEIDELGILFSELWGEHSKYEEMDPKDYESMRISRRDWYLDDPTDLHWVPCAPTEDERELLRQKIRDYLDVYRDRTPERAVPAADRPRTVYLCIPSGGEIKANAEFARQKSLEELRNGNIPLCPLLLLPSDASPDSPERADALRDIGAQMMDACEELRVCAKEWTPEMTAEIQRAVSLGIPLRNDAEPEKRPVSRKRASGKSERKKNPAR